MKSAINFIMREEGSKTWQKNIICRRILCGELFIISKGRGA